MRKHELYADYHDHFEYFGNTEIERIYTACGTRTIGFISSVTVIQENKKMRFTSSMLIERDLETGILAMSKGVAYTACIVAKMIANGEIKEKGVLSPMTHIPVTPFMERLKKRGLVITEKMEELDD